MATLTLHTTTPVTLTALSLFTSASASVPIVNLTLTSGTSDNASYVSLLTGAGNTTPIVFTPVNDKVEFTFNTVAFYVCNISTKQSLTVTFYSETRTFAYMSPTSVFNGKISLYDYTFDHKFNNDITYFSYFKGDGTLQSSLYRPGTKVINGVLRYTFVDSDNDSYTFFNTVSYQNYNTSSENIPHTFSAGMYNSSGLYASLTKQKELSSLANLYAQQSPAVASIQVSSLDEDTDTITVLTDKDAQSVIYVIGQEADGTERAFTLFSRDSAPSSKQHVYTVPKVSTGKYRVVAIPTLNSYARDFENTEPSTAIQGYAYSTTDYVQDRYNIGIDEGYKKGHEEIYSLGTPFGFTHDFVNQTNYASRQAEFVNTIADNQYVKAYNELYDKGTSQGFIYDKANTSRSYLISQQDVFINTLLASGAIPAYKNVYDKGSAYGFTYDATQTSLPYYESRATSFVDAVDSTSDSRGHKRAYSELFTSGRNYEILHGVPEGASAWVDDTSSNSSYATNKDKFIRHVYNSAYVRAKQEIFDKGQAYNYDFRDSITPGSKTIDDVTILSQYSGQETSFINTVTSEAKSLGYKDVYTYVNNQFGFLYDSTNSANRTSEEYVAYLSDLKDDMVLDINNDTKVSLYKEVFDVAATDFLFSYDNTRTDVAYYSGKRQDMFKGVYNYATRAAYQSVYDRGLNYNFNTVTDYLSKRDSRYTLKPTYADATTTHLDSLKNDFELRLFETGVIFTYKRFFDLAVPLGFNYDGSQYVASYYDNKREEFLSYYGGGQQAVAYRYVMDTAKSIYEGYNYTNSDSVQVLKDQIIPMFDWIRANSVDIISVSNPIRMTNNRIKFIVNLKKPTVLYGMMTSKITGELLSYDYSTVIDTVHEIVFNYDLRKGNDFELFFVPGKK